MTKKSKEGSGKSNSIHIKETNGKSKDKLIADMTTSGIVNSAMLMTEFSIKYGELSLTDCIEALAEKTEEIHNNDLRSVEKLLFSQSITLETMFFNLALKANAHMENNNINVCEKYMRLALKAQSQCRATLQTLAEVKNPKPYIQNNQAQYQQVNNGAAPAHARKNLKSSNELLDGTENEQKWMDPGAQKAPVRKD